MFITLKKLKSLRKGTRPGIKKMLNLSALKILSKEQMAIFWTLIGDIQTTLEHFINSLFSVYLHFFDELCITKVGISDPINNFET